MIRSVEDIEKASDAVLRAFLKAEKVPFSEDAERPELIADARAYLTKEQAKDNPPAPDPQIDEAMPAEDALRMIEARGFKSREEVVMYLGVLEREKQAVQVEKDALKEKQDSIELAELHLTEREKALAAKGDEVHADMKKQEELYEKLVKLKESLPSGVDSNV